LAARGASDRCGSNVSGTNPARSRVEDQPRPALGLRPWFALLRRARNLRRFALAIRPERVTALRCNVPIDLIAEVPGVFRCPIVVLVTSWQRLAGIKRAPPGHGVLLATTGIHSVGLKQPLTVLALDKKGAVLAVHQLAPTRTWRYPSATWILELPRKFSRPSEGAMVRLLAGTNVSQS
jgi:hypothetical protein